MTEPGRDAEAFEVTEHLGAQHGGVGFLYVGGAHTHALARSAAVLDGFIRGVQGVGLAVLAHEPEELSGFKGTRIFVRACAPLANPFLTPYQVRCA
jgi:hypothetical protein